MGLRPCSQRTSQSTTFSLCSLSRDDDRNTRAYFFRSERGASDMEKLVSGLRTARNTRQQKNNLKAVGALEGRAVKAQGGDRKYHNRGRGGLLVYYFPQASVVVHHHVQSVAIRTQGAPGRSGILRRGSVPYRTCNMCVH